MKKVAVIIGALFFTVVSCKKESTNMTYKSYSKYENSNGSGTIQKEQTVRVEEDIKGNINVNGIAAITHPITISNDMNINKCGKIIIDIEKTKDKKNEVIVGANANINDSIIVIKGTLRITGDLNNNATGFINCKNEGKIIVEKNLNQNGVIYGYKNFDVKQNRNLNQGHRTEDESLE
ncbi:MAG: hypothetical protein SNJ71_04955 [Bacteroidales bacterium]